MPRRRAAAAAAATAARRRRLSPGDEDAAADADSPEDEEEDEEDRPQQRNAANARERARMRVLSRAFCRLKTTLPWVPPDTKLSKLDTLRLAASYIAHLRAVLRLDEAAAPVHPLNLTWPFSFQQGESPTETTAVAKTHSEVERPYHSSLY